MMLKKLLCHAYAWSRCILCGEYLQLIFQNVILLYVLYAFGTRYILISVYKNFEVCKNNNENIKKY